MWPEPWLASGLTRYLEKRMTVSNRRETTCHGIICLNKKTTLNKNKQSIKMNEVSKILSKNVQHSRKQWYNVFVKKKDYNTTERVLKLFRYIIRKEAGNYDPRRNFGCCTLCQCLNNVVFLQVICIIKIFWLRPTYCLTMYGKYSCLFVIFFNKMSLRNIF